MSPYIASLRVNCDAIRKGGCATTAEPRKRKTPNYPKHRKHNPAMNPFNHNVTTAVTEYQAIPDPKPWGCLSRCAERNHTTPGAILNRINKGRYRRSLTVRQHMED
jgi:hypothetical protein